MKIWKERDKYKLTVYRADFTVRGKRYKPKAYTKEELERIIIQIKSAALRVKAGLPAEVPPITLGELVAEHLKDFDYTVEYYRRGKVVIEMFRDLIGEREAVENIKAADLRGFVRLRRSQNPKIQASSINKDLTFLSKLFSSAPQYFRELEDWSPPKLPWEKEGKRKTGRVMYQSEFRALLAYLRDPELHKGEKPDSPEIRNDYGDMLEIAWHSGMRWGELCQLSWSMVRLAEGEILLPKEVTKTKEPRIVPLNTRAKEILRKRLDSKWTEWVFPRKDGKGPRRYYADRLGTIAKKIGLPFGREEGFTLHSSRHAVVSRLLEKGVDIATVQEISGHSDRTVAMTYAHSSRRQAREAIERLAEDE